MRNSSVLETNVTWVVVLIVVVVVLIVVMMADKCFVSGGA